MKFTTAAVAFGTLAVVNADCISDCSATAASGLGCDVTDLAGCYCTDDFATAVKACLYGDSACGKTEVAAFYPEQEATCADVTTTGGTTTTSAAASESTLTCSLDSCKAEAATTVGCDIDDLAGCYCTDAFATAAKACLYSGGCSSDVSSLYTGIESTCADVSASSAAATGGSSATTSAAATGGEGAGSATSATSAAAPAASSAAGGASSAAGGASSAAAGAATTFSTAAAGAGSAAATATGSAAAGASAAGSAVASGTGAVAANSTTSSPSTVVTAGASLNGAGAGLAAVALAAGVLALF
ncbi:hypothetical protein SCUCBS95973_000568 [Sporothrix curviconia]|uniref:Extracellular membrane protein CFEM domain-containing protein n=1 Tax=Sporothrix curviconia TaxID=1260050 RepID=A0ABP0ARF2_9PEZI